MTNFIMMGFLWRHPLRNGILLVLIELLCYIYFNTIYLILFPATILIFLSIDIIIIMVKAFVTAELPVAAQEPDISSPVAVKKGMLNENVGVKIQPNIPPDIENIDKDPETNAILSVSVIYNFVENNTHYIVHGIKIPPSKDTKLNIFKINPNGQRELVEKMIRSIKRVTRESVYLETKHLFKN